MSSNKCGILTETDISNINNALTTEIYESKKMAKSHSKLLKEPEPLLAKYYQEESNKLIDSLKDTQKRILECMI